MKQIDVTSFHFVDTDTDNTWPSILSKTIQRDPSVLKGTIMQCSFERFFRSSESARDKYLSRLFGIFSEEIVRIWCRCDEAPYVNLGRPTLYADGESRGHTLDFTLKKKYSGAIYIAEMKCELEYEQYQYLTLRHAGQLVHHTSSAFAKFLQVARIPDALAIKCGGAPIEAKGAILIWGATTAEGKADVIDVYGLADVLSVETMIADIQRWQPVSWSQFIDRHRGWSTELFSFMAGK